MVVWCGAVQLGTSDNLESKFRALEGGDVEDELAQMKKGVLTGSRSSAPQQLPEGRPIRCVIALVVKIAYARACPGCQSIMSLIHRPC